MSFYFVGFTSQVKGLIEKAITIIKLNRPAVFSALGPELKQLVQIALIFKTTLHIDLFQTIFIFNMAEKMWSVLLSVPKTLFTVLILQFFWTIIKKKFKVIHHKLPKCEKNLLQGVPMQTYKLTENPALEFSHEQRQSDTLIKTQKQT